MESNTHPPTPESNGNPTGEHPSRQIQSRPTLITLVLVISVLVIIPNLLIWRSYDQLQKQRTKERHFWHLCQPGFTDDQRREAFAELLWEGNREWRGARLMRLDLSGAYLSGANIQGATMSGCKLVRADLTESILRGTKLDQADLSAADLTGADLFECILLKTDLRDAILTRTDLRGADCGQADATGANFVSANLTAARLDLAHLSNADFRFAKAVEADFSLANLSFANLHRMDLTDADLSETNLRNANWWRATGLRKETIEALKVEYPPDDDASPALREDFQKWMEQPPSS